MKAVLKQDYFWIGIVIFSGLVFAFFSFKSFLSLVDYYVLDRKSEASVFSWEIREIKNYYYLTAHYHYQTETGKKEGKELFLTNKFLNYPVALTSLKEWAKKDWPVWYVSKNPGKSTLCKQINLKNLIYSLLSLAVFLYFLILKYKVKKYGF